MQSILISQRLMVVVFLGFACLVNALSYNEFIQCVQECRPYLCCDLEVNKIDTTRHGMSQILKTQHDGLFILNQRMSSYLFFHTFPDEIIAL